MTDQNDDDPRTFAEKQRERIEDLEEALRQARIRAECTAATLVAAHTALREIIILSSDHLDNADWKTIKIIASRGRPTTKEEQP